MNEDVKDKIAAYVTSHKKRLRKFATDVLLPMMEDVSK